MIQEKVALLEVVLKNLLRGKKKYMSWSTYSSKIR
jgi:hypothetical protein